MSSVADERLDHSVPGSGLPPERLLNVERAVEVMEANHLDRLIATTPENSYYVTGMQSLFQWLVRGRKTASYGILSTSGEVTLVSPGIELDKAAVAKFPVDQIVAYDAATTGLGDPASWSPEDHAFARLSLRELPADEWAALDSLGSLRGLRVGVDDLELAEALSSRGAEVVDARPLLTTIRMIKTSAEVRRLRVAVEIVEAAMEATFAAAMEGISERELGHVFDRTVVEHGGRPYQTIIGFGNHSAYPTNIPRDRTLDEGDLIRWDCGCEYGGYVSDIARVAVVGDPSRAQQHRFQAVVAAQEAALAEVGPGSPAHVIFERGLRAAWEAGLPLRRKHLGHAIGIDMYEPPFVVPTDPTPLQAGMVIDVEVPYYELGFGGVQLEDTVVVTDAGYDVFNKLGHELVQVG